MICFRKTVVFVLLVRIVLSYLNPVPKSTDKYSGSFSPDSVTLFITKILLEQSLSDWGLLLVQDDSDIDIDSFLILSDKARMSIGLRNVTFELQLQFTPKHSYNRYSSRKKVVIFVIQNLNFVFMSQVFKIIAPVYSPVTRKDEDLFIFKQEFDFHENFLLSEFPNKVKFKIAVGLDKMEKLRVSTVCFFCAPGGKPRLIELPTVNGKLHRDVNLFQDFVTNLNGKTLRISVPYIRSKIELDVQNSGVGNALRGNWKTLFEQFLMVRFNFTYSMFISMGPDGEPGGGGTGSKLPNGSWIGVVGDLVSGRADLGIVVGNAPDRIRHIDFTNSFFDTGCLTFVTAKSSQIFSSVALLWPFDYDVWMGITFGILVYLFLLFIFTKIISSVSFLQDNDDYDTLHPTLFTNLQFLMCALIDQYPRTRLPTSHGLRCLVVFWIYFAILISNIYRTQLLTLLVFPIFGTLPSTFEQVALSDYKIGFMKQGDAAYNTLVQSHDPIYKKLVVQMEIYTDLGLTCVDKCLQGKYACIGYDFALVHLKERNLSDAQMRRLTFAPATTYNIWPGIGTEGGSIYKNNFGKALSQTRQFHLAYIWEKMDMYDNVRKQKLDWWHNTNQNMDDEASSLSLREDGDAESEDVAVNLKMKHFVGALYVYGGCVVICLITFILEIAHAICHRVQLNRY